MDKLIPKNIEVVIFEVNERVKANYLGIGIWYDGIINSVNTDLTYNIDYNDEEREFNVSATRIRKNNLLKYNIGDMVEAHVNTKWSRGTIKKIYNNFTADILYLKNWLDFYQSFNFLLALIINHILL